MTITYRTIKGSELTYAEVDENFATINAQYESVVSAVGDVSLSAASAANSELEASQSAISAGQSADSASSSAALASSSASSAAASNAAAAEIYDQFDDRYLGSKSVAPTTDNDGNPIITGALYWNSTSSKMFVWDGSKWVLASSGTTYYVANLSSATTLAASLSDDSYIVVDSDESLGGVRVRYTVASGALTSPVPATAAGVQYTPAGTGAVARTAQDKMREVVSVKDFGAIGDGVADDTAAIQAAFDSEGLASIYFPAGLYKVTGSGAACLTLTKNKKIFGQGRASTIRADFAGADTSILKVAITDNGGFLDVRGWAMRDIDMFHNGGGRHGLELNGGFSIAASRIDGCSFGRGTNIAGYGLYVFDQLSHSRIELCQFDTAYMKCFDANVISKCLTFGAGAAITFNCDVGVRNNTVRDCTIVNRDGQVVIENGDNIRIENNQFELSQGLTPSESQSPVSAMVWVRGLDRPVVNTVIRANNFGGGTNLNYLIYLDNASRTVIKENQLIAVNIAEIYFSADARYNIFGACNTTISQASNPRTRTLFKANTVDLGVGNMGVFQSSARLNLENGWVTADGFYKDENGQVHFLQELNAGTPAAGTVIGTLPDGFRPSRFGRHLASTASSIGYVDINPVTGVIQSGGLPSNSGVYIEPFQSSKTED